MFGVITNPNIYGVPENFFNVTGTEFYDYRELYEWDEPAYTADGKKDAISLLFRHNPVD